MGERHCLHCGEVIPRDVTLKKRFCCRKCKRDFHNGQRAAALLASKAGRVCDWCGKPLDPAAKVGTRFCHVNCRARYHQTRKRKG